MEEQQEASLSEESEQGDEGRELVSKQWAAGLEMEWKPVDGPEQRREVV